jgi:hypothetical protein
LQTIGPVSLSWYAFLALSLVLEEPCCRSGYVAEVRQGYDRSVSSGRPRGTGAPVAPLKFGGRMNRTRAIIALALLLAACSPGGQETKAANKCATDLFPSFNANDLKQCVPVCIKCENGAVTTCTTSCTLKGAR